MASRPAYATAVAFLLFDDFLLGFGTPVGDAHVRLAVRGDSVVSLRVGAARGSTRRDSGRSRFGTLILTFAITAIEVMMIAAVMLTGPAVSPSLATRCSR